MYFSLESQVVFITGGASGIGLSVAERFSKAGARLAIADLKDSTGVADRLEALFLSVDVSSADSLKSALQETHDRLGPITTLINNAGINGADGVAFTECDDALTRKLFEVNTMGVYNGLKHGPAQMADGGSIINTASLAADYIFPGSGPYSASKAAVASMTAMAAAELANRRIRVNAVAPSFIRTPLAMDDIELFERIGQQLTHAGRIAEPEEVAAVFHFLASKDASYINGQVIRVDGGMACGMTTAAVEALSQGLS